MLALGGCGITPPVTTAFVDYAGHDDVAALRLGGMTVVERRVREAALAGATRAVVRLAAAARPTLPALAIARTGLEVGDGWEFGMRYRLISGSLRTPQQYGFFDLNVSAYLPLQGYPPNSERNPLFHQLDVRLDKTWFLKNGGKIGFYVDVLNVYNQANSEGVTYNYNSTLSTQTNSLPILPSLGLRGEL